MEAKTDATQHKFQTHLREIETRDKCEWEKGTGACAAKPPQSNGTTSWAVFWHHFKTVALAYFTKERDLSLL
jgi:hypothetical protein